MVIFSCPQTAQVLVTFETCYQSDEETWPFRKNSDFRKNYRFSGKFQIFTVTLHCVLEKTATRTVFAILAMFMFRMMKNTLNSKSKYTILRTIFLWVTATNCPPSGQNLFTVFLLIKSSHQFIIAVCGTTIWYDTELPKASRMTENISQSFPPELLTLKRLCVCKICFPR